MALNEPVLKSRGRSKLTPTVNESSPNTGLESHDTETSRPSTGQPLSQLTLCAEGSPVSLSVLPDSDEARRMTAISGQRCSAGLNNSSPLGLLVKMCLASSALSSTRCYLTWKPVAMKSKRWLFRLVPSMPGISDSGSGFLPTIRSTDGDRGGRGDLIQAVRGNQNKHFKLYPTVTRHGNYNRKGASKHSGDGLATVIQREMLPTPTANRWNGLQSHGVNVIRGALNPQWVSWYMGYPENWCLLEAQQFDDVKAERKCLEDWETPLSRKLRNGSASKS